MQDEMFALIRETQDVMVGAAQSCLPESCVGDLRGLIRLTEKFNANACRRDASTFDRRDVEYWCRSIYGGIDSFLSVRDCCRSISDSDLSTWEKMTALELMETFTAKYQVFHNETAFERRLVILLDLFKLQILWAAMEYR
jgi:hypothetical protein